MSATTFIAVGNESINPARVVSAKWVTDPADPRAGHLTVHLGLKEHAFPFDADGVAELAATVGLGACAAEYAKEVKAREKAAKDADKAAKDADKAAEEAARPADHTKAAHTHTAHKAHG